MASECQPQQQSGKLVAVEGDIDTVATQLRLLPPSQKILVLPPLLENFPQDTEAHSFNARAFIRDVHTSFTERTERARSFLQASTTTQPRLVFMNGGGVSARATCITRISENITNGEVREAEIIFNDIVRDGVAGLMKLEEVVEAEVKSNEPEQLDEDLTNVEEKEEDPTVKAMKAADSLDRKTAELQEDSIEDNAVELSKEVQPERLDVPEVRDRPFMSENGDDIVRTVVTVPAESERALEQRNTFGPGYEATTFAATAPYTAALSHQTEDDYDDEYDDDYGPNRVSPGDDSFFSVPPTPGVVYGEACVVDVASVTPKRITRKVKSFDRFFPSNSGYADWIPASPTQVRHSKSAHHLGRPGTFGGRMQTDENGFETLPRTTFMRASTTLIKKASTSGESMSSSMPTPRINLYVDRATDAGEVAVDKNSTASQSEEVPPFQPVFDIVEDLVIHIAHNAPNEIFEYVISAYKNGSYPILPPTPEPESKIPVSDETVDGGETMIRPTSHLTAETDDDGFHRRHEFDPYAHNNYPESDNQWPSKNKSSQAENSGQYLERPTPSLTPPPTARGISEKFCEFSPLNPNSVIGIQNSLRSLLNLQFPSGENGYTQHYFPVSPEADRLWKPVFRNDDNASIGNEGRTVDQIIALGCEEGVEKDFFNQVSGQVEKLGMKRDGLNRSSKTDLRYIIANVMQTHSNLLISTQSTFNPFSSPEVLAACIVPQIESYLATNNSTRLLILHFPFSHLATVMALRKILGQDVLKIAGIMDSLSSDPPSVVSHPRSPTTNPLSNDATANHKRPSQAHSRDDSRRSSSIASHISSLNTSSNHQLKKSISFSKANYLLPSTATDAEITTFLSGISMSLMEKSTFYTPEPEPKPIIVEKPALPPTPVTYTRDTSHPPISYSGSQGRQSKIARLTGNPGASSTPPRTPTESRKGHKYTASVASTMRTTNSERVRREDARIEKDWENFYIGEEDSEDDDYDRMILGRSMAKIVPEVSKTYLEGKGPRRSTKKALKWLGLA